MNRSDTIYVAPGLYFGTVDRVRLVHINARISDADFQRFLQLMQEDIDRRGEDDRMGVLYDVPDAAMTQQRRVALGKVLAAREDKLRKITAIYVLVTASFVVRGILQAIWWLAPPAYPSAVVGTTLEGFQTVAKHLPGVDAADLDHTFMTLLSEHAWLLQKELSQPA